jgi:hypothetical protein
MTLNIQYGNGASVVVRARESLVHGEGKQLTLYKQRGKERNALCKVLKMSYTIYPKEQKI